MSYKVFPNWNKKALSAVRAPDRNPAAGPAGAPVAAEKNLAAPANEAILWPMEENIKALADAIYADKVRRARVSPPTKKMGWGAEMFAEACERMRAGV